MEIESGYWNYYMSFRIGNNRKFYQDIINTECSESVLGVAANKEVLAKEDSLRKYFEERKRQMQPFLDKKEAESWSLEVEREKYAQDELPECYFDFFESDGVWKDKLEDECKSQIAEIREINSASINLTNGVNKEQWLIMTLMPLKIELRPFEYEYCPVFVYLFENGYGVIKTIIKLDHTDAGAVSVYPMQTWFGDVKVWEASAMAGGRKEFKVFVNTSGGKEILLITEILQKHLYKLFGDNLLDKTISSCVETFVIAKMKPKQIWEISSKGSVKEKEEIYHFASPHECMSRINSERWHKFWEEHYQYFCGFDFIKGDNCRLIISTDVERLMKSFGREDIEDIGQYLNISVQRTFDLFLVIALCQKDNELYLYRTAISDIYIVEELQADYNQNCNFFEHFLDMAPFNAKTFYNMINEINNNSFVDVRTKIDRIRQVESHKYNLLMEKRNNLLEMVTLIGTVLFGLPMLYDTLTILREGILPAGNYIPGDVTRIIAIAIWIIMLVIIVVYRLRSKKQYKNNRK